MEKFQETVLLTMGNITTGSDKAEKTGYALEEALIRRISTATNSKAVVKNFTQFWTTPAAFLSNKLGRKVEGLGTNRFHGGPQDSP